ncbi:MAG: NAD(P)-dependent alcohol dehydrogenase [Gammaproteobacteria bacterium]|nr:NAD(P)-dependent alcohol dehydrogenase [Gammaproteobacteria bacterium]
MKGIEFSQYKALEALRMDEVDKPVPKDDEVLVRIAACSINSWDWELFNARPFVNRLMFGLFKPTRLKTLGFDIAGVVESVGDKVTRFKPGDEVYGDLSNCGWGGFAEYVAAPQSALSPKPGHCSFAEAAAVPQAALLAYQGLVNVGHLRDGLKIFINGASGGSGSFAVQIARQYDVEITGTCRREKMEFVRSLGVDHVIDYTQEDFTQSGQRYDLIIDAQARHSLGEIRRALTPDGIYVMHGGASSKLFQCMLFGPLWSILGKRTYRVLFHRANQGLEAIGQLIESGKIKSIIDKTFPFDQVIDALRYYGEGKARGKVVINMEPS